MVLSISKYWIYTITLFFTYPLIPNAIQPPYRKKTKHPDRTAIVTGSTGNLGTQITYELAKRKVRVIMACRDLEKCKMIRREIVYRTGHKGLACRHLDLENIESINKFADDMIENEPHIDILINNAAVKDVKTKEVTEYGIEKNFFVNFIAPYLLTFRLMDKLLESTSNSRDSRIINVIGTPKKSWAINLNDVNFDKRKYDHKLAYNQSKLALAYFTILMDKLNREKKNFLYVYGTSPCYKNVGRSLYEPIGFMETIKSFVTAYYSTTPECATYSIIRCALDSEFSNTNYSGKLYTYFLTSWGWKGVDKDEVKAKLVWNMAANMLLDISDNKEKKDKV